jgi:hypothetical protein
MPNDPAPIPAQPQALAPLAAERQRMAYRLAACPKEDMPEVYVTLLGQADAIIAAAQELKRMVKAAGLEHVEHHGEFVVGDTRFYKTIDKTDKPRDVPRMTYKALAAKAGGDEDAVLECLAADAFKPGACRKLLGDEYHLHFKTEIKYEVATGKPRKVIGTKSLTFNGSK